MRRSVNRAIASTWFKIVQARVKCYPSLFFRIYHGVVQAWVRLIRRLISSWDQFVGQTVWQFIQPDPPETPASASLLEPRTRNPDTMSRPADLKEKNLESLESLTGKPGLLDDLAKDHLRLFMLRPCNHDADTSSRPKVPTPSCVEAAQRSISCGFLPGEV